MRAFLLMIGLALILQGQSWGKTITAIGGTPQNVQSAIDGASDGDVVMIPAGTFNWSSGVTVKKAIQLFGAGNPATKIVNTGNNTMVTLIPTAKGSIELGKLKFARSGGTGMHVTAADAPGKPMLVHDIAFENTGFGCRAIEWGTNGGVVYNCTFVSTDKSDNSAMAFKNPSSDSAWKEVDYMGMKDVNGDKNTYLEDCTFDNLFLQALDLDDNSRSVVRHCVFNNSALSSHGQETSAVGGRAWELYNNEFIFTTSSNNNPPAGQYPLNMNYFFFCRTGGPGVFCNNKVADISSSAWGQKSEFRFSQYNIRRKGQVPCQTKYPAARQIGWGIDAAGDFVLDPVYIWGNTGAGNYNDPSIEDYNPDECGNNQHTADYVKKNREFYVNTPKPGYTAYTYPHPLRSGDTGPQPTPEPTATPVPTPAPTATPEPPRPTPTPVKTYEKWLEEQNDWIRAHPPYTDQ